MRFGNRRSTASSSSEILVTLNLGQKLPWGKLVAPIIVILSSEEVAAPSN